MGGPGALCSAFGPGGEDHLRINFTCTPEEGRAAVEWIRAAITTRWRGRLEMGSRSTDARRTLSYSGSGV
jgi:hypothetical protein